RGRSDRTGPLWLDGNFLVLVMCSELFCSALIDLYFPTHRTADATNSKISFQRVLLATAACVLVFCLWWFMPEAVEEYVNMAILWTAVLISTAQSIWRVMKLWRGAAPPAEWTVRGHSSHSPTPSRSEK